MGAFVGYDDVGVWMTNGERDAFLDWYATHRCEEHDSRWEYCKSPAQRWTGRCIQLDELIPRGEIFVASEAERATAATEFSPSMARLLNIISQITRGEWKHLVSSREAKGWRNA